MICMRPWLLLGVGLAAVTAARGEAMRFTSGATPTALIELFTSEGCSSCPPAERWLGSLRDQPGLWRDFVPVAFHVDYWNRLGWPDRFSTREFTQRQYDYAAGWGSGSVYTPCVVRNGLESQISPPVAPPAAAAGTLTVTYDGAVVRTEFFPAAAGSAGAFEIHAAILGGGIVSRVTAGENRGQTLPHEFIALALGHAPLGRDLALPVPKVSGVTRHALAVWVTRRGALAVLQATGGWLD